MNKRIQSYMLVIGCIIAVFSGCVKKEQAETAAVGEESSSATLSLSLKSIAETGISAEAINPQNFTSTIAVPAKVVVNQDNEALVGSPVAGRACKIFVKVGDQVKAGQVLMLVEGLEIGEIKAGFLSAKADLEYRKANLLRQKKLIEENVAAQKNMLESTTEFEKSLAEYRARESMLNAIGLSGDDVIRENSGSSNSRYSEALPVKSPIEGIVVERNVVIGQPVEEMTTAFRIINVSTVWVDGQVYEKDIDKIQRNAVVRFAVSSSRQEQLTGKVIYLGQIIGEKTRTLTIRAEFNNSDGKLRPQMFGELVIPVKSNHAALLVPAEALVKMDNADFVFICKTDSTFEKRAVVTGDSENETVEITKGIKAGEHVVTKGAFYLKSEIMKATFGEEE